MSFLQWRFCQQLPIIGHPGSSDFINSDRRSRRGRKMEKEQEGKGRRWKRSKRGRGRRWKRSSKRRR